MNFAFAPPFNFALSAAAARFLSVYDVTLPDGGLRRLLRVGDGLALVEARSSGTPTEPRLRVRTLATDGAPSQRQIAAAARHWLHPDADPLPFYTFAQTDPQLWRIVEPLTGLRSLRVSSLFEALALTIIEQQIALVSAQRAERWLAAEWGSALVYDGVTYYAFPTQAQLVGRASAELAPLKITFRRVDTLLALARADLSALERLSAPAAHAALMGFKGVGHWTASWAVTRRWGSYPYIGSADVALRAAVNRFIYGRSGRAERAETDAFFARFGVYAGAAAYFTLMRYAFEKYAPT